MHDANKHVELIGHALTIGRSPDCGFQVSDDRVSTRHCRLAMDQGVWTIDDLRSTNGTFVNGTRVGEQSRRLNHGDLVRLGAADAVLLEVRFVLTERGAERAPEPPAAAGEAQALRTRVAELQDELRQRNAELVRAGSLHKQLQDERAALHGERAGQSKAALAAERATAGLTDELEALRDDLAHQRTEHAASRDAGERAQARVVDLEARLAAQERRTRSEINDGNQRAKELESKLSLTQSELAVARAALATANASLASLQQAYDDVLTRLEARTAR